MQHKIGFYIRVSTDEQAQVIEGSLDSQKHRLQGYVDIKNMQEDGWGKTIEAYIDDGFSAKDTKRPAFQRMMKDIKFGKISLILVTDLSRLSRNILDFCILLEDLKKPNAKFLSLKEQFDTSTPAGEMMVFNMINLAQFERKQTSERVSMNFHARAMRGLRNGGNPILGYEPHPSNPSTLVIQEQEALSVKRIFEIYKQESSLSQTVKKMMAEGILPKVRPGRNDRHVLKGKWSTTALSNLLKNKTYVAEREVNAKHRDKDQATLKHYERYQIVPASWSAIINKHDFESVQQILNENLTKERKRRENSQARTFLLTGLIYCESCGRPLVGSSGHGRNKVHRYYVHRPTPNEPVNCPIKTMSAEKLEHDILNHLDEVLFREGYLETLERRLNSAFEQSKGEQKAKLKHVEAELQQIQNQIQKTLRLISEMSEPAVQETLKESIRDLSHKKQNLETQLSHTTDELGEAMDSKRDIARIELCARELKKAKQKATPAQLKRLLQKLISAITINEDGARIGYWTGGYSETGNQKSNEEKPKQTSITTNAQHALGHRTLKRWQTFENLPALPWMPGGKVDGGGYIVLNGRGERI